MKKLFGTDGIRGTANIYPLTIGMCSRLSEVLVKKFCNTNSSDNFVVIGKDTRASCDMFESALAASLCSFGVNVKLLGVCPTPAVSIITNYCGANFGIMISASHNHFSDNGIKIFDGSGLKLDDHKEAEIESMIADQSIVCEKAIAEKIGRVQHDCNHKLMSYYIDDIKSKFSFSKNDAENLKLLVDSANGSFSKIASDIFATFGFNVLPLHENPNGTNINDRCGATNAHEISSLVLKHNADLGISFDGDGDRLIISDENGNILDGDHILAALVELYKLKNTKIVSTIMANCGLEEYLKTKNIQLVRTNVGDRYISDYMRKSNAAIGGESSGHIIIKEHAFTGDGLFAALKILEYLLTQKKKGSEILGLFNKHQVVSKNVKITDKSLISRTEVQMVIQESEKKLSGHGRLIVRPSGTEPLIRVSAEGCDEVELHDIVNKICERITKSQKVEK